MERGRGRGRGRALTDPLSLPADGGGGFRALPQRERPRRGAVFLLLQGAGGLGARRRPPVSSSGGGGGICPPAPCPGSSAPATSCVRVSCCELLFFLFFFFIFATFQGGTPKTLCGLCVSFPSERSYSPDAAGVPKAGQRTNEKCNCTYASAS